jgi:hypothetical protein
MDFTALLVPVTAAGKEIADLRHLDPAAGFGLPAHVTVLYPFGLVDLLDEALRSKLRRVFAALLTLPPRSPKLNGAVERANRTHTEEFYEVTDAEATLADLRPALLAWETIYNTVRPHQALSYLTPAEFLASIDHRV